MGAAARSISTAGAAAGAGGGGGKGRGLPGGGGMGGRATKSRAGVLGGGVPGEVRRPPRPGRAGVGCSPPLQASVAATRPARATRLDMPAMIEWHARAVNLTDVSVGNTF